MNIPFMKGLLLTFMIALAAKYISQIPFLSIMGHLVIAILVGMIWRGTVGVKKEWEFGIAFSSKKLLRIGIILLGMRLNLSDIFQAGINAFLISVINVVITLLIVYWLAIKLGVEQKLGILTACGTAICGAAAIVAIAPQINAKDEEVAVGAATIAILGTIFTLLYTLIYPILGLSSAAYGIFTGGTLHEVAHVIAASERGGTASVDAAIISKLTRVALLVPVAFVLGMMIKKTKKGQDKNKSSVPVPWFIFGFLLMSGVNTLGVISNSIVELIVSTAYVLIGMAMAGLGLTVKWKTFIDLGRKPFLAGIIGSVVLSIVGYLLVVLIWT
ncbi:YeiH family putative sulfate export transporter [Priestia megaterium]|nr:YeiH family putative sulfate export transporter [Priestia megaterium]